MLPSILIVLGSIFTILGFVGLVVLSMRQFLRAIHNVFSYSKNDLSHDFDKEKVILERDYKIILKSLFAFLVIGLILLMLGLWLKYAPRGNDSLWSRYIEGAFTGNDNIESQLEKENNVEGNYVSASGKSYSYRIIVSEKTICINEKEVGSIEELGEVLENIDRVNNEILLIDDFAVSPTYHEVEKLLNDKGYNYDTEGNE